MLVPFGGWVPFTCSSDTTTHSVSWPYRLLTCHSDISEVWIGKNTGAQTITDYLNRGAEAFYWALCPFFLIGFAWLYSESQSSGVWIHIKSVSLSLNPYTANLTFLRELSRNEGAQCLAEHSSPSVLVIGVGLSTQTPTNKNLWHVTMTCQMFVKMIGTLKCSDSLWFSWR